VHECLVELSKDITNLSQHLTELASFSYKELKPAQIKNKKNILLYAGTV